MESKDKKIKILITGASGFIGKLLMKELQKNSNFETFGADIINNQNADIKNFMNVDFCDIPESFLNTCDYVFHLAAMVGVDACQNKPDELMLVNLTNTKDFLSKCVNCKVKKIIFSSSSEIYGNSHKIPYNEIEETEPFSLYGRCKKEIEIFLRNLSESNPATQIIIPRFFNVYGPSQRNDFVTNHFIKSALSNEDIEIFGDGNQTRSFTYVDDVIKALQMTLSYTGSNYEIFNIGSKYECSIKELARIVLSLIPESTSKLVFKDYGINGVRSRDLEILRRVPSTEKSKRMLGFEAVVSPQEGIKAIIKNAK